jgi:hypothetical protein
MSLHVREPETWRVECEDQVRTVEVAVRPDGAIVTKSKDDPPLSHPASTRSRVAVTRHAGLLDWPVMSVLGPSQPTHAALVASEREWRQAFEKDAARLLMFRDEIQDALEAVLTKIKKVR